MKLSAGSYRLELTALLVAVLVTAGLGTLSLGTKALQSLEYWTADWRSALLADRAATQNPRVAVVLVDDDAIEGLPYRSPVDRGLLARLVDTVHAAGAQAIGLDFLIDQATEPAKDQELLAALARARGRIVVGSVDDRVPLAPARREFHKSFMARAGAEAGTVNLRYEIDQVVRTEIDAVDGRGETKSFAAALASLGGASIVRSAGRIAWLGRPADGADAFLVLPAGVLLADASEPQKRLAELLRVQLAGRIVLIGGDLAGQSDRHATPLAKLNREPMLGVMIHAHLVAQYLDGRRYRQLEPLAELAGIFLLTFTGFLIGWRLFRSRLLSGLAPMLALTLVDVVLFMSFRMTIPFASLAIAWLAGVFSGRSAGWSRERIDRRRAKGAM